MYAYFERQTGDMILEKTWIWLRKESRKIENVYLLIAAQNTVIRINYISNLKLIIHKIIANINYEMKRLII